jgi:hypothetical protein
LKDVELDFAAFVAIVAYIVAMSGVGIKPANGGSWSAHGHFVIVGDADAGVMVSALAGHPDPHPNTQGLVMFEVTRGEGSLIVRRSRAGAAGRRDGTPPRRGPFTMEREPGVPRRHF